LRGRECGSSWTSPLLFPSLFCLGGALAVFLELEEGEASEGGGGVEVVRKEKGFAVAVERVSFPSRSPRIGKQLSQLLSRARARLSLSVCCNCGLPAPIRATCARAALPFQRRKRSARKRGAGEQEQREGKRSAAACGDITGCRACFFFLRFSSSFFHLSVFDSTRLSWEPREHTFSFLEKSRRERKRANASRSRARESRKRRKRNHSSPPMASRRSSEALHFVRKGLRASGAPLLSLPPAAER